MKIHVFEGHLTFEHGLGQSLDLIKVHELEGAGGLDEAVPRLLAVALLVQGLHVLLHLKGGWTWFNLLIYGNPDLEYLVNFHLEFYLPIRTYLSIPTLIPYPNHDS